MPKTVRLTRDDWQDIFDSLPENTDDQISLCKVITDALDDGAKNLDVEFTDSEFELLEKGLDDEGEREIEPEQIIQSS